MLSNVTYMPCGLSTMRTTVGASCVFGGTQGSFEVSRDEHLTDPKSKEFKP